MTEFSDLAPPSSLQQPTVLEMGTFASIPLDADSNTLKKKKQPRKILHFSDGTLEEYSTDEEEDTPDKCAEPEADPKTLNWPNWFAHMGRRSGQSVLGAVDYIGEGLANILGITSQKYYYEIEEYKRQLEEEEKERREEKEQMAGWNDSNPAVVIKQTSMQGPQVKSQDVDAENGDVKERF